MQLKKHLFFLMDVCFKANPWRSHIPEQKGLFSRNAKREKDLFDPSFQSKLAGK
jgi:hypothetical protein